MRTPPNSTIPHHGVEDRKQLPHARHQSHLLGFARRKQPLVELLEDRIVFRSDQSSHVQDRPDRSPPAPHLPLTTYLPGVAVEGSDPYQRREVFVGDAPKLRQLGQQRPRQDRPHPWHAPQQLLVAAPNLALSDRFVEFLIDALEILLQPPEVS